MTYKEKDILHEVGRFWVLDTGKDYSVMVAGITHSTCDSAYTRDNDGLNLAKYRAEYLHARNDKVYQRERAI